MTTDKAERVNAMALDKAIKYGKEKRKPYRGSKTVSTCCCNHGSCPWCYGNRTHKFRDRHPRKWEEEVMEEQSSWKLEEEPEKPPPEKNTEKNELYSETRKGFWGRVKNFFCKKPFGNKKENENRPKSEKPKEHIICCRSCLLRAGGECLRNPSYVDGEEVAIYWCSDYISE